ncbi:hypothetical protein [Deinococcus sp. 6GRE01]|uniref:hypothetical protein n=1 Tax=Deinococcus sp. 6GRE01 TaxID=2745873 RepID=UPI001E446D66|nr:hypothetical protein [Deinococcus sp. 6GRE01]
MMHERSLLDLCLQRVNVGRQGAAVGRKPHSGLRDRTLRDLEAAEEVHDPTDAAVREAQLVMQSLKGGVQNGTESVEE